MAAFIEALYWSVNPLKTGLPTGFPFLLCFCVVATFSSTIVGATPVFGGGGGGGVIDSGLVAVLARPLAVTWIATPDSLAGAVSPVKVATPATACTVVVKLGSPGRARVTLPE